MAFVMRMKEFAFYHAGTAPACNRCRVSTDTLDGRLAVRMPCRHCGQLCNDCFGNAAVAEGYCAECVELSRFVGGAP